MKHSYQEDANGKLTKGKTIYAFDGFKDGVIFDLDMFDEKEKEIKREVWYYDLKDKEMSKLPIDLKKGVNYIGGDRDCIITGDQDEDAEETGMIYLRNEDGTYRSMILPEIRSANDIYESERISDDVVIIRTMNKFYILNIRKGIYKTVEPNGILRKDGIITIKGKKLHIYTDFK